MMPQDLSKIHYKKCRYPSCNLTSRDGVAGLTFHAFPVRQTDRCIKWLVNCGLDDWVEMSEKDLKMRYICSRHFADENFYSTGRLKREAVPIILGLDNPSSKSKRGIKARKVVSTETDFLKKQIEKLEAKLVKERQKRAEVRAKLCATRVALSRLKLKLAKGTFQDIYLNKALANRLEGFVLTFIRMQLFHKQSTCYTTDEQRLCMMMHCISPALYSKMRDDFKFVLPNEITMIRWFNKLNISPKKANLSGSYNCEKIEQMLKEDRENRLILAEASDGNQEDGTVISKVDESMEMKDSDEEALKESRQKFEEEEDDDEDDLESEEEEGQHSEEQMQRLTVKHLKQLEEENEEMEFLEEHLIEEVSEEHLEALKEKGQIIDVTFKKGQTVLTNDGKSHNSEYVSVAYYETREDGTLTPVSYLKEEKDIKTLVGELDLENEIDDEEYAMLEQFEEVDDLDASQLIKETEKYVA